MILTTSKAYTHNYSEYKSYIIVAIFVIGNLLLPRLCHGIPQGGMIFLPIYFFTLIGAYVYGSRVGVLTAVMSPLVSCMLTGMPGTVMLPVVLAKSGLLAVIASAVAARCGKASFMATALVVCAYQLIGTAVESMMLGSADVAIYHLWLALPGMGIQIVAGTLAIRALTRR